MPSPSTRSRLRCWVAGIATHDFSPAFSAKVRRTLYNPLGILLVAALASLLCGFFLHAQGFVLAGGIVAVVGLGVVWPWLSLRGLTGTLAFERTRVAEGEPVGVRLTLRNRLPWAAWGLAVRDGFGGDGGAPAAAVASAPGRRTAACRWSFTPTRRGVFPLAVPRIGTGFPFGLWETARRVAVEAPLIVWPKTFPVGPVPPVSGDRQVEGNVSRSKVGTTGDVLGVRPYRRGDSPRRIHWGQSAKHDRLVVCELQSNSRPVIQLVLDADPSVHAGADESGSREWAVRVVASLAEGWLGAGAQVGLAWAGFELPPASGVGQAHKILDALAALPDAVCGPLADVLACPVCRGFRDGLQVIITTDRAHAHGACGACAAEDQRWVVLSAGGFADAVSIAPHACDHNPCAEPWLRIGSADEVPIRLRGGWREARHGS
ncbi:DUF58 domain-containing protein [Gemmata sp. JC673]|uniref:DUF58 domain-containing protein n=1 Tax=Gemmata algarum TaxID=2975278 RepID=A0ABU5F5B2_9BACT|nr:DUF58 domain-containing protein [Gemmata algarum]MDY3561071.1 DUF58 domain-containing protein [Gemmata algarum]